MTSLDDYEAERAAKEQAVRALYARNRTVVAERTSWPADAMETCLQLEAEHPGWYVSWLHANPGPSCWQRPAGYCATRYDEYLVGGDTMRRLPEDGISRHPTVFGTTAAELRPAIASMQERIDRQARLDEMLWRSVLDR